MVLAWAVQQVYEGLGSPPSHPALAGSCQHPSSAGWETSIPPRAPPARPVLLETPSTYFFLIELERGLY